MRRAREQVGLVSFQIGERRVEHRRIARACAQVGGCDAGQSDKAFGAPIVAEHPRQRLQGPGFGGVAMFVTLAYRHQRFRKGVRTRVARKVLIVEDNELNLKLFCDLLGAHGHEVEGVRDGRLALDAARAMVPDLIVMDIQMPHVTGIELIEAIRADEALAATPVMAVTAYAGKADEDRIRAAGADAYVSKPISLMRFLEVVEGLAR